MKKTLKFLSWMFILLLAVSVSSCKDDDEDEVTVELADAVSGIYVGKLQSGSVTIDDAYKVVISRVSSTAVQLDANFFNESAIFNVEQSGSQYILRNTSSYEYVSIFVAGNTLNVSFSNGAGTMTTFVGNK